MTETTKLTIENFKEVHETFHWSFKAGDIEVRIFKDENSRSPEEDTDANGVFIIEDDTPYAESCTVYAGAGRGVRDVSYAMRGQAVLSIWESFEPFILDKNNKTTAELRNYLYEIAEKHEQEIGDIEDFLIADKDFSTKFLNLAGEFIPILFYGQEHIRFYDIHCIKSWRYEADDVNADKMAWEYITSNRDDIMKQLQAEQNVYLMYASGDTYGFAIIKNGGVIDSCWSYFGMDNVLEGVNEFLPDGVTINL